MVLNAAARLVTGASRRDHISPDVRDVLHWLPVTQRIQFKIATTALYCVRGTGPAYFKDVHAHSGRHLQSGKPPFGPSRCHVRPVNQDTTRPTKLPCCCSNCVKQSSSSSALAIHQSMTIQSFFENTSLQSSVRQPLRTICFKSEPTYLLTYLLILKCVNLYWFLY